MRDLQIELITKAEIPKKRTTTKLKTENYLSVLLEKHRGQIAVMTKQPFVMKIKPDDFYANAKTG